jgi:hypothetical protein
MRTAGALALKIEKCDDPNYLANSIQAITERAFEVYKPISFRPLFETYIPM